MDFVSEILGWLQEWVQVIDMFLTAFLSAALVYLYSKQHSVLSRQAEIQKEQQKEITRQANLQDDVVEIQKNQQKLQEKDIEILKTLNQSVLVVEEWEVTGNQLNIYLSNLGGYLVSQIGISVRVDPINGRDLPDDIPEPTDETIQYLEREPSSSMAVDGDITTSRYVRPDETGVQFTKQIRLFPTWRSDIRLSMGFEEGIVDLREQDTDEGILTIHLVYIDSLTELQETRLIWCQEARIEQELTLQEILEQMQKEQIPMTAYTLDGCIIPNNRPTDIG